MHGLFAKDPDDLLKLATKAKESGDMSKATSTLRDAYKAISRTKVSYPIETFLRLPLYLQEAGDGNSAWLEFNQLIESGYHLAPKDKALVLMEHSTVYDKMRLFLQREGKAELAVGYGVASHFSWALGLHKQKRFDELERSLSPDSVRQIVSKLLKKAKKLETLDRIVEILEEPRNNIGRVAPGQLIVKVCKALGIASNYNADD